MKLEDIDIGIGFGNKINMGVISKRERVFKGIPIDITEKVERVMINYLNELETKSYEWHIRKDGKTYSYKVSLEIKEIKECNQD